jgi:RNA polymerase primary sigma factor
MGRPKVNRTPQILQAKRALSPASRSSGPEQQGSGDPPVLDIAQKVKELVRLAQEQGYLTYNDISDSLPDSLVGPEELDEIYVKLRNLEVEIVDQAEVDRIKQPGREEEEEKVRLDILDDPVRMYLKQMGQVPLLNREQEVEISKRIEAAEEAAKGIICAFGFAAKEHIALAEKLVCLPPKERFDRVILEKKAAHREAHLRALRKLIGVVRATDQKVDAAFAAWQRCPDGPKRERLRAHFRRLDHGLQKAFPKFFYKQKVIEEIASVAENLRDKVQASRNIIQEQEKLGKSPQGQAIIESERGIGAVHPRVLGRLSQSLRAIVPLRLPGAPGKGRDG